MAKPSKNYLEYFEKYRNNQEEGLYSIFSNMEDYKKFIKDPDFNYHNVVPGDCHYVDCPWCQGDLR